MVWSRIGHHAAASGLRSHACVAVDLGVELGAIDDHAPIAYDDSRKGFRLTDPTFQLAPVELTQREVFSFSIARKLLERFEGTPQEMDMRSVLSKIANNLQGTVSLEVESLTDQFTVLSEDHARVDPEVWQRAGLAINQMERLRLRYQRFDGATREYLLEPYHLVAYHGNWYLLALNAVAGRLETFALSRCRSLAGTRQHFTRPVSFDPKTFFKDSFGISHADQPWKVRLLFAPEVATYIRERIWHPSQNLRQRRNGALELRLQTSSRKELTRWILSWMPHVQVAAPRQLKDRNLLPDPVVLSTLCPRSGERHSDLCPAQRGQCGAIIEYFTATAGYAKSPAGADSSGGLEQSSFVLRERL